MPEELLEELLKKKAIIVSFISWTTAIETKKKDVHPGVAFWINFDWPGYSLHQVESLFCRLFLESGMEISLCKTLFLESGMEISLCKTLVGRGKILKVFVRILKFPDWECLFFNDWVFVNWYNSFEILHIIGKNSQNEMAAALLFQTLKDHKHAEPIRLFAKYYWLPLFINLFLIPRILAKSVLVQGEGFIAFLDCWSKIRKELLNKKPPSKASA